MIIVLVVVVIDFLEARIVESNEKNKNKFEKENFLEYTLLLPSSGRNCGMRIGIV